MHIYLVVGYAAAMTSVILPAVESILVFKPNVRMELARIRDVTIAVGSDNPGYDLPSKLKYCRHIIFACGLLRDADADADLARTWILNLLQYRSSLDSDFSFVSSFLVEQRSAAQSRAEQSTAQHSQY